MDNDELGAFNFTVFFHAHSERNALSHGRPGHVTLFDGVGTNGR